MYCDEEFNVLIANKRVTKEEAVKLPFKWTKFNKVATAAQIRAEYDMVYGLHIVFPGYYDVRDYNQLSISAKDVEKFYGKIKVID